MNNIALPLSVFNMLEVVGQKPPGLKLFVNKERRQRFIELTPHAKGNLWKVRYDGTAFRVFYGTAVKAWCSSLPSAVKFIDEQTGTP